MKPTINCKYLYVKCYYYTDHKILHIKDISFKTSESYYGEILEEIKSSKRADKILTELLGETTIVSCETCLHKHIFKLTGNCETTYEPN